MWRMVKDASESAPGLLLIAYNLVLCSKVHGESQNYPSVM